MQSGNPAGSRTTSVESTEMFITNTTPLDGKTKTSGEASVLTICATRSDCATSH